jgi:hypothetical protein
VFRRGQRAAFQPCGEGVQELAALNELFGLDVLVGLMGNPDLAGSAHHGGHSGVLQHAGFGAEADPAESVTGTQGHQGAGQVQVAPLVEPG